MSRRSSKQAKKVHYLALREFMMHFLFQRCQLLLKRLWKGTTITTHYRMRWDANSLFRVDANNFICNEKKKWNKLTQSHRALMLPLPMLPLLITSLFLSMIIITLLASLHFIKVCECHFRFVSFLVLHCLLNHYCCNIFAHQDDLHGGNILRLVKLEVRCADGKVVYDLLCCV